MERGARRRGDPGWPGDWQDELRRYQRRGRVAFVGRSNGERLSGLGHLAEDNVHGEERPADEDRRRRQGDSGVVCVKLQAHSMCRNDITATRFYTIATAH